MNNETLQDSSARQQEFDVEATLTQIHADAVRRSGFDDFGPPDYLYPLRMLVAATADDGASEHAQKTWLEELTLALIARAVREASWRRYPEFAERRIEAPLVICGLPRTGTTALHKLLAMDPQFQGLDHWLTTWPIPRPPREEWSAQPGYQIAAEALRRRFSDRPQSKIAHDVTTDEVDECLEILRLDFVSNRFPAMRRLAGYDGWFQQQDETPYYRQLVDTLKLIGLHDDRRWLLKNPGHLPQLGALLEVLPDARVVITHRDPVKSLTSICSLLSNPQTLFGPEAGLEHIGRRELSYWAEARRKAEEVRRAYGEDSFLDVDHADFHRDPMEIVRKIYERFDLVLSPAAEQAMRRWMATHPVERLGQYHFTLEDFGITEEEVRRALENG